MENAARIRGIFITHGHEDHIGGVPYVLRKINPPIYTTRLTTELIKLKLDEHHLLKQAKLNVVDAGETVKAGCFSVEFIHINHSISTIRINPTILRIIFWATIIRVSWNIYTFIHTIRDSIAILISINRYIILTNIIRKFRQQI